MPAKNPRLSVVLSPSLAAILAAIADETGESASSIVRGLLEQCHPALERMLQLVRAAKGAKGNIGSGVGESLKRTVADLEDALALADGRTGKAVRDLVDAAQEVRGRRRPLRAGGASGAPPAVVPTPGPVTRGSGSPSGAGRRGRRAGR